MILVARAASPPDAVMPVAAADALLRSLGTAAFGRTLLDAMWRLAGADHCSVFRFEGGAARCIASASRDNRATAWIAAEKYVRRHWRHDPVRARFAAHPRGATVMWRITPHEIADADYRRDCYAVPRVVDKLAITRADEAGLFCVCAYRGRDSGLFGDQVIDRLRGHTGFLATAAVKHAACEGGGVRPVTTRLSADGLQPILVGLGAGLTEREIQVLTGILLGKTSEGVGLDLGIKLSSVITYRKRAYARLNISSQAELFALCLGGLGAAADQPRPAVNARM